MQMQMIKMQSEIKMKWEKSNEDKKEIWLNGSLSKAESEVKAKSDGRFSAKKTVWKALETRNPEF